MTALKSRPWLIVLILASLVAGLLVVRHVRRAFAEGVPLADPLYVGGVLTDEGVPVDGARDVTVRLFAESSGGTAVCTTTAPGTAMTAGRFRIPLDVACAGAVHANPDLWLELQVGDTTFPGRSKLGAVPYALEATRAVEAGGALQSQIAEILDGEYCPRIIDREGERRVYVKDLSTAGVVRCTWGRDEMVQVGDYWIDRFEASVWPEADCTGTQRGASSDDYGSEFPNNGNWTIPLYACSIGHVAPSRFITWFQAQQACIAAGKRLCTNEEWQGAAAGTQDPGAWPGPSGTCSTTAPDGGRCNTCSTGPRNTGEAGAEPGGPDDCVGTHGPQDMVGNVWEWVGLWMQAGRTWQTIDFQQAAPWPSTYGSDGTGNVNGTSNNGSVAAAGCPAAARRGGAFFGGEGGSGVFAFNADSGPSYYELGIGFRCCRGR